MSKSVNALNMLTNTVFTFIYNSIAAFECPCCGAMQKPYYIYGTFNENKLYILCYCDSCQRAYIAEYTYIINNLDRSHNIHNFLKAYPNGYKHSNFNDHIKQLSPNFIKIYDQALTADSFGLDEIAGMGFRKALEFLVKDYAISKFENDAESIKSMSLMNVIKNKINNPHITLIAEKCTWLLNDEVHYFRKYEQNDIKSIKDLIEATALTISAISIADSITDSSSTPPTA